MALKVTMFSDFICPFCFIGYEVVKKLSPEFDIELDWRGFEIHPEWPAEGLAAADYLRSRGTDSAQRKAMWGRIEQMAEAAGFSIKSPARMCNSRLALEVQEYAREIGKSAAFAERVYAAYFQHGLDIGDRAVVSRLAAEAGIEAEELALALESQRYALRLKNNTVAAHQRGVDGVPTFFIGPYPVTGAQSEEIMRQVFQRASELLAAE